MQMSFFALFKDTKNFIINKILIIVITLILLASFGQLMMNLFAPTEEILLPLQQLIEKTVTNYGEFSVQALQATLERLPKHQQEAVIGIIMSYAIKLGIVYLITNLISTSISLSLIANLSRFNRVSIIPLLQITGRLLPKIVLFIIISIPFFILLMLLSVLIAPLMLFIIIIGSVFYTLIYTLFLVVITEPSANSSLFGQINESWSLLKAKYKVIMPIIGLWLIIIFVLSALISDIASDNLFLNILTATLSSFFSFFVLSYFYRLRTLTIVNDNDTSD